MEFLNTLNDIKQNIKPYKEWKASEENKEAQFNKLKNSVNIPQEKIDIAQARANAILNAVDTFDEKSEDAAEDMEQASGLITLPIFVGIAGILQLATLPLLKNQRLSKYATIVQQGGIFLAAIPTILMATKLQKDASRIARFEVKEKVLNDPKYFVAYTKDQVEAAKIIAKNMPDEEEQKPCFAESISNIKKLHNTRNAYKEWVNTHINDEKDREKLLQLNLTPQELANANETQELITKIVKKVNINAEEYSENAETAFETMSMCSFIAGPIIGAATYFGAKLLGIGKNNPKIRKMASFIVGAALPVAIIIGGTSYQKKAARIGRFKAKQELNSDPRNFVYFDKTAYDSVAQVKSEQKEKGFIGKLFDDMKFTKKLIKDGKEYNEYQKTQAKEDAKLRKALLQVELKDGQLDEAKHIQDKTFMTFEKLDEMSQRYSEDVESLTQIIQQAGGIATVGLSGLAVMTAVWAKNKISSNVHRMPKFMQNALNAKSFNSRNKALWVVGGVLAAPIAAIAIGIPFAIQSIFTKAQKSAGKIGMMKALEDLNHPEYFANKSNTDVALSDNSENSQIAKVAPVVEQAEQVSTLPVEPQIVDKPYIAPTPSISMNDFLNKTKNLGA